MKKLSKVLAALALPLLLACSSGTPTGPSGLQVSPAEASVASGDSLQLVVVGPGGEAVNGDVVWRSSNPVAVAINSGGTVTGVYANGAATVTATVGGVRAEANVNTVPRFCFAMAPLNGSPNPGAAAQTFEVKFDPGTDAAKLAAELAARFRFELQEVGADGFKAELTPEQVGQLQCHNAVASVTYL